MPGMLIGGTLIAALGAGSTVFVEKKNPSGKSLTRDFLIGAILFAMILQLLPESTANLVHTIVALLPAFTALSQKGGGESGGGDEQEVQVGIPKF
jgi:glucose uptake protein GlcU